MAAKKILLKRIAKVFNLIRDQPQLSWYEIT